MKEIVFLIFFMCMNYSICATSKEPFFINIEAAIQTLDNVYSTATLGQRNWHGLSGVEIIKDLQIWGEHFCETQPQNTKTAILCFQLIEFYLTGGFGIDTQKEQTTKDQLVVLKAISSAVCYRKSLYASFFELKHIATPSPILEQELRHVGMMVAVAEAFHSPSSTQFDKFLITQTQWLEFLTIDRWLLQSELNDQKIIQLASLPPQSYIEYLGTANSGVDRYQEDNNGFVWLSNFYVSGGENPNSSIHEQEGVALSVRYGSQEFKAFNVETLHHMHKMVISKKFKSLEDAKEFSDSTPDKALKTCRSNVKRTEYDEKESNAHMLLLLKQKYYNNKNLAKAFLNLGHCLLFEGNKWGDILWGMHFVSTTQFSGMNKLGKMLARTQKELMYEYSKNKNFRDFVDGDNDSYTAIPPLFYPEILFK